MSTLFRADTDAVGAAQAPLPVLSTVDSNSLAVQGVDLTDSCAQIVPKVYKYTQKYNIFLMSEKKIKGPRRPPTQTQCH